MPQPTVFQIMYYYHDCDAGFVNTDSVVTGINYDLPGIINCGCYWSIWVYGIQFSINAFVDQKKTKFKVNF